LLLIVLSSWNWVGAAGVVAPDHAASTRERHRHLRRG